MAESDRRVLARSSGWSSLSFVAGAATGPLLSILIVRSMPHREYGSLSLGTDAVGIIATLASFGLGGALTQLLSSEATQHGGPGQRAVMSLGFRFASWASAAALIVMGVTAVIFMETPTLRSATWTLVVMAPVAALAPVQGVIVGAYRAFGWPGRLASVTVVSGAATAVAVLTVVLATVPHSLTVGAAFDARPAAFVIAGLPALWLWRKGRAGPDGPQPSLAVSRLLSLAIAFALTMIFASLVAQLDVLVLGAFDGTRAVGIYAPTSAVAGAVVMIAPYVVGNWYLPLAARRLAEGNAQAVAAIYHFATRAAIAITSPLLALVLVCPGAVLTFLFGHGIAQDATALRIMGAGALAATLPGFNSTTLDAKGLAGFTTRRLLVMISISVCLCFCLVPLLGANGAALATALALIAENVVCSLAVHRRLHLAPWDWRTAAVAGALGLSIAIDVIVVSRTSVPLVKCGLVAACTALLTGGAFLATAGSVMRFRSRDSHTTPEGACPAPALGTPPSPASRHD